jgi:hypothetical protein
VQSYSRFLLVKRPQNIWVLQSEIKTARWLSLAGFPLDTKFPELSSRQQVKMRTGAPRWALYEHEKQRAVFVLTISK